MRQHDENEWTVEERAAFDALSAERIPPPELKARTVNALHVRGLLGHRPGLTIAMIAAAALVIFAAGALVGYSVAERRTPPIESSVASTATRQVVWY